MMKLSGEVTGDEERHLSGIARRLNAQEEDLALAVNRPASMARIGGQSCPMEKLE
jgi:hypothetical protein